MKLKKGTKVYQGGREFNDSIPKAVQEDIKAGLAKKAELLKKSDSPKKAKTLSDLEPPKEQPNEQAVKKEKSGGKIS